MLETRGPSVSAPLRSSVLHVGVFNAGASREQSGRRPQVMGVGCCHSSWGPQGLWQQCVTPRGQPKPTSSHSTALLSELVRGVMHLAGWHQKPTPLRSNPSLMSIPDLFHAWPVYSAKSQIKLNIIFFFMLLSLHSLPMLCVCALPCSNPLWCPSWERHSLEGILVNTFGMSSSPKKTLFVHSLPEPKKT